VSLLGIDAIGLRNSNGDVLTGAGVNIGQVEVGRVPVRGFDSDANSNAFVIPAESRTRNGLGPVANNNLGSDNHPLRVASVMIGGAGAPKSVAPGASLYSSGLDSTPGPAGYADNLITTQYIAKRFPFNSVQHVRVYQP